MSPCLIKSFVDKSYLHHKLHQLLRNNNHETHYRQQFKLKIKIKLFLKNQNIILVWKDCKQNTHTHLVFTNRHVVHQEFTGTFNLKMAADERTETNRKKLLQSGENNKLGLKNAAVQSNLMT